RCPPSGASASKFAPWKGMVAEIVAEARFKTSKSPWIVGLNTLVAVATGTKTVLLSVQKTMFTAAPGRLMDPRVELEPELPVVLWSDSVALLTVETVWSVV